MKTTVHLVVERPREFDIIGFTSIRGYSLKFSNAPMEEPLSLSGSGTPTSRTKSVSPPRTEEFYSRIYQQVATGVAITNWQGVFQQCNPAFCAMVGYTEEELRTRDFVSLIHPEDRQANLLQVRRLQVGEIPSFEIESRYLHKNGAPVWGRKFVSVLHGEDREPTHLIALVTDVTERRRAQERLLEYEKVVEVLGDRIVVVDREYRYVMANAAFLNYRGFEKEQVIGHTVAEILGKETFEADIKHQFDECFQGKVVRYEVKYNYPELGARNIAASYFPIRGPLGIDRIACVLQDITERKAAEEALRESEERFRLIANNAPVMIWMSGPDKLCNYFNQPWLEFTGRRLEADLGNGWSEWVHPEDVKSCMDTYTRAFDLRESFRMQYRLRRHDGEYRWLLDIGVPRLNLDGSLAGYIGSCLDITDYKLAREALAGVGRRLIEAHEEERTWIARELHDDISQRIALASVKLEQFDQQLPEFEVAAHVQIRDLSDILADLRNDIHALSHRLHSSKLEYLGVVVAASGFCKELSEQQKVEIDFRHKGIPRNLPKEISLCLFRVLQEALQNAVKHSGVRKFNVELLGMTEAIQLTVSDRGVGFDPQAAVNGLGLISMRERLQLVDGKFSIESKHGCGTTIRARVPHIAEKHRAAAGGSA